MVGKEKYYPQPTPNCRYYIKPNEGSCGKGIKIVNRYPIIFDDNYTVCPEIITRLKNKRFKYDYRVWIGIKNDLSYYVCKTLICRISNIPFSLETQEGTLRTKELTTTLAGPLRLCHGST